MRHRHKRQFSSTVVPLNIKRRAQVRADTAEMMLALDAAQRVYDAAIDDALAARRRPLVP